MIYNAERIAKILMNNQITVVSGLAEGIDYITQYTCADYNYKKLIAVIGTPISKYYPIKNKKLQKYIKFEGLFVSEYANFENTIKWNFLRRNYLMSSISNATIVIEAGDTSGTVSQARSTLKTENLCLCQIMSLRILKIVGLLNLEMNLEKFLNLKIITN